MRAQLRSHLRERGRHSCRHALSCAWMVGFKTGTPAVLCQVSQPSGSSRAHPDASASSSRCTCARTGSFPDGHLRRPDPRGSSSCARRLHRSARIRRNPASSPLAALFPRLSTAACDRACVSQAFAQDRGAGSSRVAARRSAACSVPCFVSTLPRACRRRSSRRAPRTPRCAVGRACPRGTVVSCRVP